MAAIIRELPTTSPQHYLTGMTAVNIPSPDGTGDWHFRAAFFGYPDSPPRYTVAGVNCIDTTDLFGNAGIYDCKSALLRYGVFGKDNAIQVVEPVGPVYAADHYRASADLLINRLKRGAPFVELYSIDDWLSTKEEKTRFFDFIQPAVALGERQWQTITEWFNREMTMA